MKHAIRVFKVACVVLAVLAISGCLAGCATRTHTDPVTGDVTVTRGPDPDTIRAIVATYPTVKEAVADARKMVAEYQLEKTQAEAQKDAARAEAAARTQQFWMNVLQAGVGILNRGNTPTPAAP